MSFKMFHLLFKHKIPSITGASRLFLKFSPVPFLSYVVRLVILFSLIAVSAPDSTQAAPGWSWYKTDTHVHSSVSADAFVDIGIHAQAAQAQGYDALFLSDHNGGSSFQINGLTANHMVFEDTYTRWDMGTYGTLSATTNALASTPVNTGTQSLHLASSSSSTGETYVWTARGPNLRSGNIILKVSIYPTRIDAGSGVYVSASIGGDPRVVTTPYGYTTAAGVVSPGKSTVLVWQLGSGRASSSDPNARVITRSLGSYTLNTWNTYTINVSNALASIPAADLPLDYNGLVHLKMAAVANNGTADAYFDTYSIDASAPVAPASEYVHRTSIVDDFNTSTFQIFPSYEMGQQKHSQRFNFGITNSSEYVSYTYGSDGIVVTQQSGYPSQLNHPGTTITEQEAIQNQGLGADFLEVYHPEWVSAWDAILQQGVQIIGGWSSDTHSGVGAGRPATFIYAPALDFDELLHSYYEGRVYNATNNFTGQMIFNLNSASQDPYPARYPVYVSDAQATANASLAVTAGLLASDNIRWVRNGNTLATDIAGTTTYQSTKSISLTGATTYVRAEVSRSSGTLRGLTEPIFFLDVPGLPTDKSFHVERIVTTNNRFYNKMFTKGITAASWSSANSALSVTLENPANALITLLISSNSAPQQVMANGSAIGASSTLANFEAATTSTRYYDAAADLLYLKVKRSATIINVVIGFGGTLPTPTRTPTNTRTPTVTPTATLSTGPVTFLPVADTYVRSTLPSNNYGTVTTLRADASSPIERSYLRFNVQGLGGTVTQATLRIYTNNNSNIGFQASRVSSNTWGETTTTYSNAPAVSSLLGSSGATTGGTWKTLDVTSYVTGNGTFSFALSTTSNSGMTFPSRESGANAPQLIVSTQTGPSATSTNTGAPTFTPTATSPGGPTPTRTSTPTLTATSNPSGSLTFLPVSDSYVNEGSPTINYGTSTTVRADASPVLRSYLRFNVGSVGGPVTRATLRIYTNNNSSIGFQASRVTNNTWGETTITYSNAPAVGSLLGSSGATSAGTWKTVDVTPYVTGNGTFSFALSTTSTTAMSFPSREAGANAPQLIVETQSGPAPTVIPTNTSPGAATPTRTSTPALTATSNPSGSQTFLPVDDSYVNASSPAASYGTSTTLRMDASPILRSYLRFNVQGLGGTVTRARLRVFANSASNLGSVVNGVSNNTWTESTLNYNNAPALGSVIGSSGSFGAGAWVDIDITAYVTGNGTYNLALTTASSTAISLASRESSGNAPQLIIETSP
ncbi:MAG: DNRLRE domain-containing protein [Chloroflexi bacterium]|nr:MAG: DNRLRE domain-containing protein [Chloroflexota bacterium]